jgi:PD-(D/E)XK nuclease superfamily
MNPLPWSHSALTDFLNCPKAYYHKRIAKDVVDPPNSAGLAGDFMHKAFEAYLKDRTPLPETYPDDIRDWPLGIKVPAAYKDYLDAIIEIPGQLLPECRYALTKELQPCGFFSPEVWCRAILDVLVLDGQRATVLDHKTGKRKPDSRQLKLSALMVFAHHPEVMVVKTGYFWMKEEAADTETYVRTGMVDMWNEFLPDLTRYRDAAKSLTYTPRPSGLCNGWCPVTECEYWKPKRR